MVDTTAAPAVVLHVVQSEDAIPDAWWASYDATCLEPFARRPGVVAARRGTAVVGSVAALAVYDVTAEQLSAVEWAVPDQVSAPGIQVTTVIYRPLLTTVPDYVAPETAVLHAAFFRADREDHDEFNDWYDTEHVPAIVAVAGYENCRRFAATDDDTSFLALYDVTTLDVAESKTAADATQSPWSDRIRAKIATARERRVFVWDRVLRIG